MSKHISMCFPQQLPSNKTTTPTKIFRKWEISVCFSVSWCWHRMQLTPFCLMLSEYKIQHLRIFWTILYNFFFLIIHHYPCLHFYFLNTAFIRSLINYFHSGFFFGCCFFVCFFNFHPFLVSFSLPSFLQPVFRSALTGLSSSGMTTSLWAVANSWTTLVGKWRGKRSQGGPDPAPLAGAMPPRVRLASSDKPTHQTAVCTGVSLSVGSRAMWSTLPLLVWITLR